MSIFWEFFNWCYWEKITPHGTCALNCMPFSKHHFWILQQWAYLTWPDLRTQWYRFAFHKYFGDIFKKFLFSTIFFQNVFLDNFSAFLETLQIFVPLLQYFIPPNILFFMIALMTSGCLFQRMCGNFLGVLQLMSLGENNYSWHLYTQLHAFQ